MTIDEIAAATAFDTPTGNGISSGTVRKALNGVPKNEIGHEHTGYDGLLRHGFVKHVDNGYQISLPDPHPGPGSRMEDDE
jgi:hypothetical protein